jgi:hypothetical protein
MTSDVDTPWYREAYAYALRPCSQRVGPFCSDRVGVSDQPRFGTLDMESLTLANLRESLEHLFHRALFHRDLFHREWFHETRVRGVRHVRKIGYLSRPMYFRLVP